MLLKIRVIFIFDGNVMTKKIKDKHLNSNFVVVGRFGQTLFSKRYIAKEVNSFYTVNEFELLTNPKTYIIQKTDKPFDPFFETDFYNNNKVIQALN